MDLYPTLLGFSPVVSQSYQMTLTRTCFLPIVITRGSDQVEVSSKFEVRNDLAVVRNYANILLEFAKITPDGLVCFFPSYLYMESIVSAWNDMGMLEELLQYKLVFIETPDANETANALENYRAVLKCNLGMRQWTRRCFDICCTRQSQRRCRFRSSLRTRCDIIWHTLPVY